MQAMGGQFLQENAVETHFSCGLPVIQLQDTEVQAKKKKKYTLRAPDEFTVTYGLFQRSSIWFLMN